MIFLHIHRTIFSFPRCFSKFLHDFLSGLLMLYFSRLHPTDWLWESSHHVLVICHRSSCCLNSTISDKLADISLKSAVEWKVLKIYSVKKFTYSSVVIITTTIVAIIANRKWIFYVCNICKHFKMCIDSLSLFNHSVEWIGIIIPIL